MEIGFYELFYLFCFSAVLIFMVMVFAVAAFALGAFVVYRTKRDASEPFIRRPEPKQGGAGQAGDMYELGEDEAKARGAGIGTAQPSFYGVPDEEEIPMGGDVDRRLYGDPERRNQFLSDFEMTSQQFTQREEAAGPVQGEQEDKT